MIRTDRTAVTLAIAAAGAALLSAARYAAPSPERIEQVATMSTPRSVHTATALRDGTLLLVGGMAANGTSIASVDRFDPATNRVRSLAPLHTARASHTATLLGDGSVLVIGGYDGEYLRTVERFDPATQRFTAAAPLREARSGHTATTLADGRILIAGGVGTGWTFLSSAEVYDPATGRSEHVGAMAVPRESHTAVLLGDGRVLIVGGHAGRREQMVVYASAEIFDPRTNRFETTGSMATARHKHDAIRLRDGRVLVVAGADRTDRNWFTSTELFDATRGTFTAGPELNVARYKIEHGSVLLPNGDVLVATGAKSAELLDVAANRFRVVGGDYPSAYHFATASMLPNGQVIIAGGYTHGIRGTDGIWRFRRDGGER